MAPFKIVVLKGDGIGASHLIARPVFALSRASSHGLIASSRSCLTSRLLGPEVVNQATRVLETLLAKTPELELELAEHDFGGIAIDNHGEPLPQSTLDACLAADAILMGAYRQIPT